MNYKSQSFSNILTWKMGGKFFAYTLTRVKIVSSLVDFVDYRCSNKKWIIN